MSLKERYYGKLTIDPPLRDDDKDYLIRFNKTRHCKRDVVGFGTDGEFWVEEKVADGETYCEPTITDVNTPPGDQPNLTCPWVPSKDGRELVLDNRTEHEDGFLWLSYLMKKILSVRGYSLSGTMMRRDSSGIYKMTWKDGKPLHAKIEPSSEYEDSNFEDEFTKEVGPLVAQIVKRKREECDKLEFKDLEHLTALLKSVPELTLVKAVHNCKLDFDVQKDYISRASKTWTKEDIGEIYPILKERCVALRTKKTAELKGKLKVGQFGTWTGRDGLTKRGVITKINKTKLKADVRDEDGNISRWTVPISMVTPDAPSKKRPADDLPTKSFKKNKIEL